MDNSCLWVLLAYPRRKTRLAARPIRAAGTLGPDPPARKMRRHGGACRTLFALGLSENTLGYVCGDRNSESLPLVGLDHEQYPQNQGENVQKPVQCKTDGETCPPSCQEAQSKKCAENKHDYV